MSYHDARGDFYIESTVFLEKVTMNCFFSDTVELKLAEDELSGEGVISDDGIIK